MLNFDFPAKFDLLFLHVDKNIGSSALSVEYSLLFCSFRESHNNTFWARLIKMIANKALAADKEKRMDERYDCEAIIKWSYFNKDRFFNAKILNFSRNGIYVETSHEIKPRTTIFIRVESLLSENTKFNDQGCLSSIFLGEVKWCNELSIGGMSYYRVGLRQCEVK